MKAESIRAVSGQMASSFPMLSYALALFFMKGLSLLMLPVVTRYLTPEDMGQLELIAVSGSFAGLLISAALHEALYRFASTQQHSQTQQHCANQLFSLALLISVTASAVAMLLITNINWSPHWPLDRNNLLLMAGSLSIESALAIGLAWLRMLDRTKPFLLICVSTSCLQVILVLLALELGFSIPGILAAGFLAHGLQLVMTTYYGRLRLCRPELRFSAKALRYCIPLMLSGLVAFGLNGAERWFILSGESLAILGQYAIAAKLALAMCILVQPFSMWWMPKRFQLIEQQPQTATRISEAGIFYICMLSLLICVAGQWVLQILLPQDYALARQLVAACVFMVIGKEFAELLNLGMLYKQKTPLLLAINYSVTTLALLACFILHQQGIWVITVVIGAAQLLRALLIFLASQHCYRLPWECRRLMAGIAITLTGLLAIHLTDAFNSLLSMLCSLLLLGIVALPTLNHTGVFKSKPTAEVSP